MTKSTIFKAGVLASTGYAVVMLLHWPEGFTFFTQLSNLYAAAVILLQLIWGGKELRLWKYSATVSIIMTFLVYLLIMAPLMPGGILGAYAQDHYASLFLHVITPILTVVDFLINDYDYTWSRRNVVMALWPPVFYLLFIFALSAAGFRWGQGMAAPYMFLNYIAPAGWFGFMPETISYTTTGIGVFYIVILLVVLFLIAGRLLLVVICRRKKAAEIRDL